MELLHIALIIGLIIMWKPSLTFVHHVINIIYTKSLLYIGSYVHVIV